MKIIIKKTKKDKTLQIMVLNQDLNEYNCFQSIIIVFKGLLFFKRIK